VDGIVSSPINLNFAEIEGSPLDPEPESEPESAGVPESGQISIEEAFPAVARLAEGLMQEARQELAQAEAKAVWLLSAAVIALGAVSSALISGKWTPGSLKSPVAATVLWLGFAAAGAALYWLAMSLMPKMVNDTEKHRLRYFGHAAQYGQKGKDREAIRAELGEALVAAATQPNDLDRLAGRLFDISSIVLRKYLRIRHAIQALGLSVVLVGLAILLEAALR
jgi:hypothetical protein